MHRPRVRVIAAVLTPLVSLAACNPFVTSYRRDPAVQMHRDGETMASQWNGTLAATADRGATALTGVVTATPGLDGASTYVSVTLASARPGTSYAWRLREGQCGGSGGVVGPGVAYRALAVNEQGHAAAAASLPLRLATNARYHVRVGAFAADSEAVVACSDLAPPTR
jgi:hypothetical protein